METFLSCAGLLTSVGINQLRTKSVHTACAVLFAVHIFCTVPRLIALEFC